MGAHYAQLFVDISFSELSFYCLYYMYKASCLKENKYSNAFRCIHTMILNVRQDMFFVHAHSEEEIRCVFDDN